MKLRKSNISKVLKALDKLLTSDIEIVVCGGMSGIMQGILQRTTTDFDVIFSSPKLESISAEIEEVANRFHLSKNWLNDGAKGFIDFLPKDFTNRLLKIEEGFKHITLSSISRVDFFILKLSSMRPIDLEDISNVVLSDEELKILKKSLTDISRFDQKKAHKMELFIREYEILKRGQ